jgi:HK97 family phage major capsid protein
MELNEKMEQLGATIKNDLESNKVELKGQLDALQTQFDQLSAKNVEITAKGLDFQGELKNVLSSTNEDLLSKGFKFTLKAAMTPAIAPEQIGGIYNYANRKVNVRNLLSIGSTSQNAVNYVQEQSYTSFTGTTAEGQKRPQSEFSLVAKVANVQTVGTFLKVTKEALADVDGITSYIANRAPAKLKEVEDAKILSVIKSEAQPFSGATLTFGTGFTANEYDVLRVAIQMIAKENYSATGILVSPTDKTRLELTKEAGGAYLFPAGNMSVAGVPVVESTCIADGDFLVGDFKLGAELKEREGISINFYNQNATDVEDGLVTIGVEERFALPIYNPKSFVSGSFAAGKAKLKS